jgi:hypothetical protein
MSEAPVSYNAAQAGQIVGKSAYWMKAKARAGKIPHTRVGREYRWLPEHLNEILLQGEKKPGAPPVRESPAAARPDGEGRAPGLVARQPRRKRDAA